MIKARGLSVIIAIVSVSIIIAVVVVFNKQAGVSILRKAPNDHIDGEGVGMLIGSLDNNSATGRKAIAEQLARRNCWKYINSLKCRVNLEQDVDVARALNYALGAHGEKDAAITLANRVEYDRLAVVYLVNITGRDFGFRADLWKEWLRNKSNDQFREIAIHQRNEVARRKWHEYAKAYADLLTKARRGGINVNAEFELLHARYSEAAAWVGFSQAITCLEKNNWRGVASDKFRQCFEGNPKSHYSGDADELSIYLGDMFKEDLEWKEPGDVRSLSEPQLIAYNIYHLRNVSCRQTSQPGTCNLLDQFAQVSKSYNAAIELRNVVKGDKSAILFPSGQPHLVGRGRLFPDHFSGRSGPWRGDLTMAKNNSGGACCGNGGGAG